MLTQAELVAVCDHPDASTRRALLLAHLLRSCAVTCRAQGHDPDMTKRLGKDLVAIAKDLDELADSYEREARPDPKGAWT
jgi:hypothetical protein